MARGLAAAACAAAAVAWLRVGAETIGGAFLSLAGAAAVVPLALAFGALADRLSPGRLSPGRLSPGRLSPGRLSPGLRRRLGLGAFLLPLGLLLALPTARLVGRLALGGAPDHLLLMLLALLVQLPAATLADRSWRRTAPAPLAEAVGALLGAALASQVIPALSGLGAAVALILAARAPSPRVIGARDQGGPLRLPALALATLAVGLALAGLRAMTDPSLTSTFVVLGVVLATASLGRALGPTRGAGGLVLAAASVVLAWLLLWKGPGVARMVVLSGAADAGLLPSPLLRLVPLAVLVAPLGLAAGLAWGPRRASASAWLGMPLGALLLGMPGPDAPLWLAGAVAGSALLWTLWRPAQVGGLAVAGAAATLLLLGGRPEAATLAPGAWSVLRQAEAPVQDAQARAAEAVVLAQVDAHGALDLRVPADRWDAASGRPVDGSVPPMVLELDGLRAETRGRAAEAETLGGHLVGLLAPREGTVLVLGDDAGRALTGLVSHPVGTITVATPAPVAVRGMAALDSGLRGRWLDPRVALADEQPADMLRRGRAIDAIVEVSRAPWSDAFHAAITPAHLDQVRARLAPDGIYVLVLHLGWLPDGAAAAQAASFADHFPVVQAWLPPFGADSLILVGTAAPIPYRRLVARLDETPGLEATLDAEEPADLASLAIADGAGLRAWQAELQGALPSPTALGPTLTERPVLHLSGLATHIADPAALWELAPDEPQAALQARLLARASFLHLLGEASTGNMEAVFRRARELQAAGGKVGAATLEPLIEPHLRDARAALDRARTEGLASKAWDDALRYATTARMLAPTSPRPLDLLGDIALGRGKITSAEEDYQQALDLDPADVPALTGLGRAARARGDLLAAEGFLRKATDADPRDWRTWQNLGRFLAEQQRLDEGEDALRKAIQLSEGQQAGPYLNLAELQLDQEQPAAGLLTAEKALGIQESGYAWYLRGRAHYDLDQLESAQSDFRRAVLLAPDLALARGGIGLVLWRQGELEQAADAFRTVLRLSPQNAAAREDLKRIEEDIEARAPAKER